MSTEASKKNDGPALAANEQPVDNDTSRSAVNGESTTPSNHPAADNNNNNADTDNNNATNSIPIISIFYVMESFKATATPVTITMMLSALASNFIRTEASAKAREVSLTASYSAISVSDEASSSEKFGIGLINGLAMIGGITAMTFLVVLLYKYRCMKILYGYMAVSVTFLLGYYGGVMIYEAIQRHELWISKISFALFIYNFTVVGIYSIFFQAGVPPVVGQGYLICVSVILAWELSHFSEITAWVLLCLLALYDLFAVLAPCGPLKALVNLMGQDGAPQLQGLLYQAQLPPQARRQSPSQPREQTQFQGSRPQQAPTPGRTPGPTPGPTPIHSSGQPFSPTEEETKSGEDGVEQESLTRLTPIPPPVEGNALELGRVVSHSFRELVVSPSNDEFETVSRPTGTIPLALAKLYKIPLVNGSPTDVDFTPDELKALVQVYFPRNGGRMERLPSTNSPSVTDTERRSRFGFRRRQREPEPEVVHYHVIDRHGVIKRKVFVGEQDGKVYRVLDQSEQEEEDDSMPGSIKLGLGDFIFYSVLVSKASLYSFTTFAACVVGILAGLLLTLLLLAIRGKALPALPISIFFGVAFYLPTRYILEPWIHEMFWNQLYT